MRAEILTIGTELLLGKGLNTNAQFIAERLTEAGIRVDFITTVGDEKGRIEAAFKLALERADVVVATGGLGPTEDDLTREALSAALGRPLALNEMVLERIRRRFAERGLPISRNNEKQALVPEGAEVLENPRGTAPGLYIGIGRKVIVALPGVPSEMRPMLVEQVIPRFRGAFGLQGSIRTRILKLSGIAESRVDELIGDLMKASLNPAIALLAHPGEVHVVLVAKGESEGELEGLLQHWEEKVRERLRDFIFGRDEERLEEVVGRLLRSQGKKVAVAESLTGGLVAHRFTNVPGSSAYFEGGIVAYSERLKEDLLGVPPQLIQEQGAVSREVAEAMAEGIRKQSGSDVGLGITGIAGPSGGTEDQPVGLVYIALSWEGGKASKVYRFSGDREAVKLRASQMALDLLRRYLLE